MLATHILILTLRLNVRVKKPLKAKKRTASVGREWRWGLVGVKLNVVDKNEFFEGRDFIHFAHKLM